MEAFLPLDSQKFGSNDLELIRQSHKKREFVLFDEELSVYVNVLDDDVVNCKFMVDINDNDLLSLPFDQYFTKLPDSSIYLLNNDVLKNFLFKSFIVMNSGHHNKILFKFDYYHDHSKKNSPQSLSSDSDSNKSSEYLESFEQINLWEDCSPLHGANSLQNFELNERAESKEFKNFCLEYPIYSLLNIRLRNTSLKEKFGHILSSLDLQSSKQFSQLAEKLFPSAKTSNDFHLAFSQITLSIIDNELMETRRSLTNDTKNVIDPIRKLELPLNLNDNDSYSIIYDLPFTSNSIKQHTYSKLKCKILLNLTYTLIVEGKEISRVKTSWKTDVTLKRQISNELPTAATTTSSNLLSTPNQLSSSTLNINIPTPRLYGSRFTVNTFNLLLNNKLNNVNFKFMQNNVTIQKGKQFELVLQIINNSQFPLDLVVYYNNKQCYSSSQARKNYPIILLSNDYKAPLIQPNETYFVSLKFVAILKGFYQNLSGLKTLDLQTNELIEIGNLVSVLVE